jgi:putative PIN family toxin of toxin-antitoxin system
MIVNTNTDRHAARQEVMSAPNLFRRSPCKATTAPPLSDTLWIVNQPPFRPFPRFVLDTNVVLDCFVFDDRDARSLRSLLDAGHAEALVHAYTIAELQRVLGYAPCRLSEAQQKEALDRYISKASHPPLPDNFATDNLLLPPTFPRCRDADDQPFLALAYHAAADALVTKDKALLKLRRKAKKFDVTILRPSELQAF